MIIINDQPDWFKISMILGSVRYGSPYKRIRHMRYAMDRGDVNFARLNMRMAIEYALSRGNANVEISVDDETHTFSDWTNYLYGAI